jgi:ribonuclease D
MRTLVDERDQQAARALYEHYCSRYLDITIVRSEAQVETMLEYLRSVQPRSIQVDCETARPDGGGALSPLDGTLRLIQIGYDEPETDERRQWLIDCHLADPHALVPLLRTTRVEKVIHFSSFEESWARVQLGTRINNVYDTWAAWVRIRKELEAMPAEAREQLVPGWQRHNNKLQTLVDLRLGIQIPKENANSEWGAETLTDEQIRYAALDVACLGELARETRALQQQLDITDFDIAGLRAWALRKDVDHAFPNANQRDEHERVVAQLRAARTREELDRFWTQSRKAILTAGNRGQLAELRDQLRVTLPDSR